MRVAQAIKDFIGVFLVCFGVGWCLAVMALPVFLIIWFVQWR